MFIRFRSIVLILILPVFWAGCDERQTSPKSYPVVRFIQVTDTHLGQSPRHDAVTAAVVRGINGYPRKIDFVVHTGDVIDDGGYDQSLQLYQELFATIDEPFYPVAGNNDFDLHGARTMPPERVESCAAHWRDDVGPLMDTADFPGLRVVMITTEPLIYGVDVGIDLFDWLEQTLKEATEEKLDVLVFTHSPSVRNFYRGQMSSPYPDELYNRLKDLLNRYHVKGVIAGHFHVDQQSYCGDVPVYIAAASVSPLGAYGSFRVYEYDPNTDQLTMQTLLVE